MNIELRNIKADITFDVDEFIEQLSKSSCYEVLYRAYESATVDMASTFIDDRLSDASTDALQNELEKRGYSVDRI